MLILVIIFHFSHLLKLMIITIWNSTNVMVFWEFWIIYMEQIHCLEVANHMTDIICYYLQITRQPSEFCVLLRVWKALFCTKSFFHKNQGNQFWSCILLRVTQWHINFGNPLSPKMTRGRWPECEPLQRKDHQHHLRLTTGIIRRSRNQRRIY